jgi:hypothetical protein
MKFFSLFLVLIFLLLILFISLFIWCENKSSHKSSHGSCPACKCPQDDDKQIEKIYQKVKEYCPKLPVPIISPVLAAYYTFYQDPNCMPPCFSHPCTASILSDPAVTNSKLDLIIINPIAPSVEGAITLSFINNIYTGEKSKPHTYYPPPPPIKKGIADVHSQGKKVLLSFMPGSAVDNFSKGEDWWDKFKDSCQYVMTNWDIDGYDFDCEQGECPPSTCGPGDADERWNNDTCVDYMIRLYTMFKSLKPNKGRGNIDGSAIATWTGELTWQMENIRSMAEFVDIVDYLLTMNENYSVLDPVILYNRLKNFSSKGYPMNRIVIGVKAGGCWSGSDGDGTDYEHLIKILTQKVEGTKTLVDVSGGMVLWNLGRDYGCRLGRGQDFAPVTDGYGNKFVSKICKVCKGDVKKDCPIGTGGLRNGEQWQFLRTLEKYVKK